MKLRAQLLLAAAQRDCTAMQQAIREDAPAPALIDLQVQQRLQHASVAALCPGADRAELQAIAALLQPMLQERDDPMLHARGLQWLALVHLAQRQGQFELARRWLDDQQSLLRGLRSPVADRWLRIVSAMDELQMQRPEAARTLIEPMLDGNEPVQAHVVLLLALRAQGDEAAVRRQQAWLAQHRGRAIAEVTALQVWQPLNVYDVSTWATPATAGAP